MNDIKSMWSGAGSARRLSIVVGLLLIVAVPALLGTWAMNKDYEALFTDLSEPNAATMIAELDRMKVPYRLEAGGTRIAVPKDLVHKTRLQLAGKNLPLNGAVGFEIFNNTDFGMTEFTQKVNYQRALQGELTRTIMAIEEVQSARVHLVLPESSLFKREQNKPKASVTLAVKPGHVLGQEQVASIQRLVSAAVPGIDTGDVTVIDQRGATLSRRGDTAFDGGFGQLDVKRRVEDHMVRKISTVLDRAFGPGQGVVSVDVSLNFDQIKVTTEEVLAAKGLPDAPSAGVIVRERQNTRDVPASKNADGAAAEVTTTDTEYQTGRRVEQIVTAPGSIRRIQVGVVVPPGVPQDRIERIQQVVSMAAGLDRGRGDAIALYALDHAGGAAPSLKPMGVGDGAGLAPTSDPMLPVEVPAANDTRDWRWVAALGVLALLTLALLGAQWFRGRVLSTRAAAGPALPAPQPMAQAERVAVLENLRSWLDAPESNKTPEVAK